MQELIDYFRNKLSLFESFVNVEILTNAPLDITIIMTFEREQYLLESLIYPDYIKEICNNLRYNFSPCSSEINVEIELIDKF